MTTSLTKNQSPPEPSGLSDLEHPSINRRVLAGTGMQVFARVFSSVASMAALLMIDRALTQGAFGLYNFYVGLFSIGAVVVDFGLHGIAVREIVRHPEREAKVMHFVSIFRLVVAVVVGAVIVAVATQRGDPGLGWVTLATLHLIALSPGSMSVFFHARVRFRPIAVASMLGSVLTLVFVWSLYRRGWGHAGAYLLAFGVGFALRELLVFLSGTRKTTLFGGFERENGRFLLREATPVGISAFASSLYAWLDSLLLMYLAGRVVVGDYSQAFRLFVFARMVPQTFCQALFPILARLAVGDPEHMQRVLRRGVFYLSAVIFPAAALTPFLGAPVLDLLWEDPAPEAAICLAIFAVSSIAIYLVYPQVSALTALGKQATFAKIALGVSPVKLVLIWGGFHWYGLPGAALATLTTEFLVLGLVSFWTRRYLGATGLSPLVLRPILTMVPVGLGAMLLGSSAGVPALLAALGLQLGGVFLAGVLPFDLSAEKKKV